MSQMELVWRDRALGAPVLASCGNALNTQKPELSAAVDNNVYIYSALNKNFTRTATINVKQKILDLKMGLSGITAGNIVISTADRIMVYGIRQGMSTLLWETQPETDALFVSLALADLNQDQREEIIAAAQKGEALYFYELTGTAAASQQLALLAIRSLPGPGKFVARINRTGNQAPAVAAAYDTNNKSGLITLAYTPRGFEVLGEQGNLPLITALAGGRIITQGTGEVAWAGIDQIIRVSSTELKTLFITEPLPDQVTALAIGSLSEGQENVLVAATKSGKLLGFGPPLSARPVWTRHAGAAVTSLCITADHKLVVGTSNGEIQVWQEASQQQLIIYTVRPGDTLWKIARVFNISVQDILSVNRINNPELIYPGQIINIPVK